MIEYLVACAIVFGIFWLPVDGIDGDPLIVVFADAVRAAFEHFSAAVSLP
ncbi:hypothetical protein BH10PSE17_BH10PSE17_01550 [soil metagenome]